MPKLHASAEPAAACLPSAVVTASLVKSGSKGAKKRRIPPSEASELVLSLPLVCLVSLPSYGWNSELLHRTAQRLKAWKTGSSPSYDWYLSRRSWSSVVFEYMTRTTVIWFWVRVPVLSEAIMVVEPSVSTDSRFLTSTFFSYMRLAVRARDTVTVARRPSGTFATIIPIMKTKLRRGSGVLIIPMMKKVTPRKMAMEDTMLMKPWISFLIGVSSASVSSVRPATVPMKVRSPMAVTMPQPLPSMTLVV